MAKVTIILTDSPTKDLPSNVVIDVLSDDQVDPKNPTPAQKVAHFMLKTPYYMHRIDQAEQRIEKNQLTLKKNSRAVPENPSLN